MTGNRGFREGYLLTAKENQARDDVLRRMLKIPPKPRTKRAGRPFQRKSARNRNKPSPNELALMIGSRESRLVKRRPESGLVAADQLRLFAFAGLDGLDDVCSGFPLRRLDRSETSVSGVSTDLTCCHVSSPPFPGLCPPLSGIGLGLVVSRIGTRNVEISVIPSTAASPFSPRKNAPSPLFCGTLGLSASCPCLRSCRCRSRRFR